MEYLVGLLLSLAVAVSATVIGMDRDRAFYPTVLIVIASYYVLFSVMGGSAPAFGIEIAVASGFALFAALGFKKNLWLVAAAIAAHGDNVRSLDLGARVCQFVRRLSIRSQ